MAMSTVRCPTTNWTRLSMPSPRESHRSTNRQLRKRSGWSTSIACPRTQRLRQSGRRLRLHSGDLRLKQESVLCLNGVFTSRETLRLGLDTTLGCSAFPPREPRDSAIPNGVRMSDTKVSVDTFVQWFVLRSFGLIGMWPERR